MHDGLGTLSGYDLTWIQNINKNWVAQKAILKEKTKAMMACLFHYNLGVALLLRYLGNNYVGTHRDIITAIEDKTRPLINNSKLVNCFIHVTLKLRERTLSNSDVQEITL